ncbi:substrate-binding periplasmic protein [Roseateles sp. BYS78W]|uniref:Substrate-binding periplasmic protein n=1 Tax=Pelomonas candidula TaxID=3299025 RepID=A0ABW7HDU6_9BURK
MRRRHLLSLLAVGASPDARPGTAASQVVYPLHDQSGLTQWRYHEELLRQALRRSGAAYEIAESTAPMTQARVLRELANGAGSLDLAWTMTSIEREALLKPVRVPVERGLIGFRLAFVRPEHVDRWKALRSVQELRRYVAGQGMDWPDTEILRANGLPVQGVPRHTTLFEMLRMGRIDYFPRSAFEIDGEVESGMAQGLVIEPHVLLRYPAASYLFVRRGREQLAADLQRGLDAMVADGSFVRLFQQHFGDLIRRHRLRQRTQIVLNNPLLPPETPLHKPGYWFVLD